MKTQALIFLVDDDPINNLINQKLLSRAFPEWNSVAFLTAREALDTIKERIESGKGELPGIILLDINMPVLNGWDFLMEYQDYSAEFRQGCRLFILSSSLDKQDIGKAKQFNDVRDYLTKPLGEVPLRNILTSEPTS